MEDQWLLGSKAMKCKWSDEDGECELRCGITDDPTCDGSEAEQYECAYVDDPESSNWTREDGAMDIEKLIQEMQEKEKARQKMIAEQIKKGCGKCSQWDEYFGCDKCERV